MQKWIQSLFVAGLVFGVAGLPNTACAADKEMKKDEKKEEKKDEKKKDPKDMTTDELEAAGLCPISRKASKPVYHADYKDKEYHFCSRDCQKAFKADPAKYFAKK